MKSHRLFTSALYVYDCTSNLSRFITLVQAATKSFTNFSFASALAYTSAIARKLGVGAKYKVGTCGSPFWLTCFAVSTQVEFLVFTHCFPGSAHIQQVYKKIVGQAPQVLSVNMPCFEPSKLVFKARIPPINTVNSGTVSVSNCALSINIASVEALALNLR